MIHQDFCLLVNPFAGKGRAIATLNQIKETLSTLPIHFHTAITEDVTHAKEVIHDAVMRHESIIALGGDGTIRAIANQIHRLNGCLAIIPAGRGNDLARTLGIPKDPVEACKLIAERHLKKIDIAHINGECFLSIASVGFDSVANHYANSTKIFRGASAYLYGGLRALLQWQPADFEINIDGKEHHHRGYTVAIANSPCYGGGMFLAPKAELTDGYLDVVLISDVPKYQILLNLPRLFTRNIEKAKGIEFLRGKEIMIKTDSRFIMYADGDPLSATPLTIKIDPLALSIYTPAT